MNSIKMILEFLSCGLLEAEQGEQSWTGEQLSVVSGWMSENLCCSYCDGHLYLHWTVGIAIPT